jgi:hypothetical protein
VKYAHYLAGAALVLGSHVALAQTPYATTPERLYVGAGAGKSDIDAGVSPAPITSGSFDGEDDGIKAFVGFRLGRHMAIEGAWVDLGKARYNGNSLGVPVTNGTLEASGLNASLVGLVPLGERVELFGKVGAFFWEAEARDQRAGLPFSRKNDGTDLSAGVGANFYFARHLGVRVEAERFEMDNDAADMISASVIARF